MRPGIVTVLTAAPWERELVATARMAGLARVVGRARTAFDVDRTLDRADAVVVGAETGWLSAALLRRWQSMGVAVVGVVTPGDRPGEDLLRAGDVSAVVDHDEPAMRLLTAIVSVAPQPRPDPPAAALATVVGPRGAPGRSEVALALAWLLSGRRRTLLAETDSDAPGLGLRLGMAPGPGIDGADPALGRPAWYRRHDPIELLTVPAPAGPLSSSLVARIVESARQEFGAVVVDAGPAAIRSTDHDPGTPVLVIEPSPAGLYRAGRMVAEWCWPEPLVVANRLPRGKCAEDAIRHIRAATGLEPLATISQLAPPRPGEPPPTVMIRALDPVVAFLYAGSDGSHASRAERLAVTS